MKIINIFQRIHGTIVDILFPAYCEKCHELVKYPNNHWCEKCLPTVLNVRKIGQKINLTGLSLTNYKTGTRELIRDIKFHRRKRHVLSAKKLLDVAFERSADFRKLLSIQNLTAIPVPLHPDKEKSRGFNQVELIFKDWLNLHGVTMKNLLIRVKDTEPNYKFKNKSDRENNLNNAFQLNGTVQEKNILIVDDIFTTGTTVSECAKVLKSAGVENIFILVLASDY